MGQLLERVVDVIIRIDNNLNIKFISNTGLRWLGGSVPIIKKSFIELIHKDDVVVFKDAHLGMREYFSCEVRVQRESQESWTWTCIRCYLLPEVQQYMICMFDISKWKNTENVLLHAVEHDSLTELPNRTLLRKIIDEHITNGDLSFSVALLDLDGFKKVNDTYGHLAGDRILIETAKRLNATIGRDNIAARLSGDEFVLVLRDSITDDKNEKIITRLLQNISRPYELGKNEAYLSASIGIANYPDHGEDYTTLLKNADIAMYQSKTSGKNRYSVFAECKENVDFSINAALHKGIRDGEFYLEYQPQFTTNRGLVGVEALMRWDSSIFGRVPPDKFIPIAEESGLMTFLGKWALRCACHQLREFSAIMPDFIMSVNVSPLQFKDDAFDKIVMEALEEADIDPSKIILEITESTLMRNQEQVENILNSLKQNGIQFSIDDFGTGFSSLSYLTRLPVSKIKIDKTFISALDSNTDKNLIIAMINLAHAIGLQCVAEGVETNKQFEFLKQHNCDFIQGYLLGKPMSADNIIELMYSVLGMGI